MSTNWDGVQYNIYSEHHDGGVLQFASASSGLLAPLGADVDDVSQQWILHPTGGQWAYSVENWEFGTYASVGSDEWVRSAAKPRTWYLVPREDDVTTSICIDAICSRVWAPLSQVDPSQAESNDIILVAPSGAEYEVWDIIAVGSATRRPSGAPTAINATPGSLQALKSCAPCGSEQCTFTPSGDPSSSIYSVLIGQPVANCNAGSQEPTTTTFGGAYGLEGSFSVDVTSGAGLGFLGPSIGTSTTVSMANKTRIEKAQEVEVKIRPGQIGALVANITYVTTPGLIRVDRSTLAFVSVDPKNVLGYSVVYTDCGSAFQALTLPKVECSGSSASRTRTAILGRRSALYVALALLSCVASSF